MLFEKRFLWKINSTKIATIAIALLIAIFFMTSQSVVANSGPTYWKGYPSSEVLVVDEQSSIQVESENLLLTLGLI